MSMSIDHDNWTQVVLIARHNTGGDCSGTQGDQTDCSAAKHWASASAVVGEERTTCA